MYHIVGTMSLEQYCRMRKLARGKGSLVLCCVFTAVYLLLAAELLAVQHRWLIGAVCILAAAAPFGLLKLRQRREITQFRALLEQHQTDALKLSVTLGEQTLENYNVTTESRAEYGYGSITRVLQDEEFLYIVCGIYWVPLPFSGMTTAELKDIRSFLKNHAPRARWK